MALLCVAKVKETHSSHCMMEKAFLSIFVPHFHFFVKGRKQTRKWRTGSIILSKWRHLKIPWKMVIKFLTQCLHGLLQAWEWIWENSKVHSKFDQYKSFWELLKSLTSYVNNVFKKVGIQVVCVFRIYKLEQIYTDRAIDRAIQIWYWKVGKSVEW